MINVEVLILFNCDIFHNEVCFMHRNKKNVNTKDKKYDKVQVKKNVFYF